jgi:hypothetical protein
VSRKIVGLGVNQCQEKGKIDENETAQKFLYASTKYIQAILPQEVVAESASVSYLGTFVRICSQTQMIGFSHWFPWS